MSLVINDESIASQLIEERQARGLDQRDEVWDGVYIMVPIANNEHQGLAAKLLMAIGSVVDWQGLGETLAGANVSDRRDNWQQNYRIPDVLVFLNETTAEDCGTHWLGGPDLAIEIVSPGDRTLDKLEFYAEVNTRELLVVDREPWQLTLYRLNDAKKLVPVAVSSFSQQATILSDVVPLSLRLEEGDSCIRLMHPDGQLLRDIPIRKR